MDSRLRVEEKEVQFPQIVQLMLVIHRFHICRFAHLLKFICDPKIKLLEHLRSFTRPAQNSEKFEAPALHVPG